MKTQQTNFHSFFSFMLGLVLLSQAVPATVQALEAEEGDNGKMLLFEAKEERQSIRVTGAQVRDPFNWGPEVVNEYLQQYQEYSVKIFKELTLSGIIWSTSRPMAIIDNTLLGEGDSINSIYVVKIDPSSVLLQKESEQYTLEFEEMIIDLGSE